MLLLGSELPQDMDSQALVIRIRIPDGGAVDWTVQPATQLLFRDILDVIGQVLPDATTTAFEYEDEDGDRITVRSDEEMKAMLSYYCSMVLEQQGSSPLVEPLQIYPRACKPPGKRNIHGLKVNTRGGSLNNCNSSISDSMPSNSLKTSSAELKKILANGERPPSPRAHAAKKTHMEAPPAYVNGVQITHVRDRQSESNNSSTRPHLSL
ncbi:dual specificity mitogen-activated protein kinase kinase 5-like [Lithobates pipiens]